MTVETCDCESMIVGKVEPGSVVIIRSEEYVQMSDEEMRDIVDCIRSHVGHDRFAVAIVNGENCTGYVAGPEEDLVAIVKRLLAPVMDVVG
jgi:hypothetical protein